MTASIAVTQPAAARPVASRTLSASALPTDRLHFGLASPPGDFSWMQSSGVPWKYRYTYLSAGVNTSSGWETWNTPSGAYATFYMNATDSLGAIPVFSYYEMLQSQPSTGSTEIQLSTWPPTPTRSPPSSTRPASHRTHTAARSTSSSTMSRTTTPPSTRAGGTGTM